MNPTAITALLQRIRKGDHAGEEDLLRVLYPELRRLARSYLRRERRDHTLQATALVNEAYIRVFGGDPVAWEDKAHLMAVLARRMRQILVDHARARASAKRGGDWTRVTLNTAIHMGRRRDEDLIAVDEALCRLHHLDTQAAQVVELRFFGGLSEDEIAAVLGVSASTAARAWKFARAWLFRELDASAKAKKGR
ncbi:MAG: ECF-type sigma factor [Acidobacteria bacterium]|nr:ECF-type sigma factor [Acidobacteriota bacterium]